MPKAKKAEPVKFRIMLRGGPKDNYITEIEDVDLPLNLYVPVPPPDISFASVDAEWKVASYSRSDEKDEFDIDCFYDYGETV